MRVEIGDLHNDKAIEASIKLLCSCLGCVEFVKDWSICEITKPDLGAIVEIKVIVTVELMEVSQICCEEEPLCAVGLKHKLSDEPSFLLRYIDDPNTHTCSLTEDYSCVKNFRIVD